MASEDKNWLPDFENELAGAFLACRDDVVDDSRTRTISPRDRT